MGKARENDGLMGFNGVKPSGKRLHSELERSTMFHRKTHELSMAYGHFH